MIRPRGERKARERIQCEEEEEEAAGQVGLICPVLFWSHHQNKMVPLEAKFDGRSRPLDSTTFNQFHAADIKQTLITPQFLGL